MTQIRTKDDFEQRLKTLTNAAIVLHKASSGQEFSIEYNNDGLFISFILPRWNHNDTDWVQPICELTGLQYHLTPLNDKLIVTLS